jgi:hypothetical protein
MALDRKAMNGSFDPFSPDSAGQCAPLIVDNVRTIAAENAARLAEQALQHRSDITVLFANLWALANS